MLKVRSMIVFTLAAAIGVAAVSGQAPPRRGATIAALLAFAGFYQGQYVVLRGTLATRDQAVLVSPTADRTIPLPSIMIAFPQGVQTPLTPLGSKLQSLWRYCDLGWNVRDETKYNLDVFGLSWSPIGARIVSDFFEKSEGGKKKK